VKNYDDLHKLWSRAHNAGSPTKFARNCVVYKELNKLAPGFTLDAGCGTGEYSMFLAELGHKVTAFDPSPYAVERFVERGGRQAGVQMEVSTIEDFCSTKMFNNIVCIEVFEHLAPEYNAMKKLYSLLKPGGMMVISVPATPLLYSEGDRVSGHHRRYSRKAMNRLLGCVAFRKRRLIRYGFPVLFFYLLFQRIFLDNIIIKHFSSSSTGRHEITRQLSKLFPTILFIDCLNLPFWSTGYVAICRK